MKIIVTGAKGQLGTDLLAELSESYPQDVVLGIDRAEVDLCDRNAVLRFVNNEKPDAIMHLAAYTAVDKAESDADACTAINVGGTKNVTDAAEEVGAKILYISTDYVFDGTKNGIYDPNDKKNPLSVYGKTKSEGEDIVAAYPKHFIVRTSWVFGKNGRNFPYTMLNLARAGKSLKVINDQVGSPTYTPHLSKLIAEIIHSSVYGIYHCTNEGFVSWYDFTKEIMRLAGINDVIIKAIHTDEYSVAAKRPLNSRLSKNSLYAAGFHHMPTWQEAIYEFMKETGNLSKGAKQ
ncbi:MAG: dTDP-4-dehydrorhamnose reductase [Bacilli bacterium]|jgi:dTDP-4-dehydrorhamnose reductase|nr:dTDP-4-dehydrorhamnose reductase [Bacilli bacterium]